MLETQFAPAERAPETQVMDLHQLLSDIPLLGEILRSVPDVLVFLNEHRQIVFANDAAFCFLGMEPTLDLLGNRPGNDEPRSFAGREPEASVGQLIFIKAYGFLIFKI